MRVEMYQPIHMEYMAPDLISSEFIFLRKELYGWTLFHQDMPVCSFGIMPEERGWETWISISFQAKRCLKSVLSLMLRFLEEVLSKTDVLYASIDPAHWQAVRLAEFLGFEKEEEIDDGYTMVWRYVKWAQSPKESWE